jgi:hypothetical protein
MFDTTLNVIGTNVIPAANEEGSDPTDLQLILVVGAVLPIATGPGQPPLTVPMGVLRFPIGKDSAVEIAENMVTVAEELADPPKASGLVLPSDPSEVENLAREFGKFRG